MSAGDGGLLLLELPELERNGADELRHAPEGFELEELGYSELAPAEAAAAWPIARHCSTLYRARRSSGTRRLSSIGLLVVHCTQSSTARGAAAWFANPRSRGSAHVVVDELECFRTLPPSAIPWGAPGANGRGWHLELAGFAQWNRREWLRHRGTIERAAYKLALHGRAFNVPLTRLTTSQLRAGRARGIVDHRQCSKAFGGSHWDVGDGFPWDVLLERARYHRRRLK